ncbi:MAG: sporulation protein [Chitinophagales bacterium]
MGFFSKVKDKLGIGGVSIKLQIPGQVAKDSGIVEGKIILTTKSEQEVIDIEVKLNEEFTTGRGDEKKSKVFELGSVKMTETFTILPGDTKEIPFAVPFTLLKSNADELSEMGGAFGAIGKLGKFTKNEKSAYFVQADVDVKSAFLDPTEKKEIRIV